MKILGLLTAWYVEDWIELAIQQALELCDEVVVSVGSNTDELLELQDQTLELAKKYDNQVSFVPTVNDGYITTGRCKTLNDMLTSSELFEPGNWIFMLDADEFYFPETYDLIKEIIRADEHDEINIEAKFFFVNMTRYLHSEHPRLWKIHHHSCLYRPTQNWPHSKNRITIRRDAERRGMFHYSLLMRERYKELQWQTEYKQSKDPSHPIAKKQRTKIEWLKKIYRPFELENEDFWIEENLRLFGYDGIGRTPFYNHAFKSDANNGGRLFRYEGPQPPIVENSPLSKIPDFRKLG